MALAAAETSASQRSSLSGGEKQCCRGVKKAASFTRLELAGQPSKSIVPRKAASFMCLRAQASTTYAPRTHDFVSGSHPDALRRRQDAERRRATLENDADHQTDAKWWEREPPRNMVSVSSPFEYQSLLEMGNLVIADFFVPWCQACRALHPKLKQIAQQNPDVLFLTVNGGDDSELRELCVGLGVTKLPYFHLYRGGELIEQFAANLTKVDKIRAEIAALKQDPFEEMGFTSFGRLDSLPPI